VALPSVLMGKRELAPRVSGKIRPGIMVLTKNGQGNKKALEMYQSGVAEGRSFEDINDMICKECGTGLMRPINTPYFTVRGADFAMPEIAHLLMSRYGEVREDGVQRLYRFPIVFGSDELARIMDFRFQCFTASGLKYWSAESDDGKERLCRTFAPIKMNETSKRAVRMPAGRDVICREDNGGICEPRGCSEFQTGQCKMRGRLLFYIPGIPGASLIEVPTGSKNFGFESEARLKELLAIAGTLPTLVDGKPVLWLAKRLHRDIPMIDYDKGRTTRTDQWIIEIEADIDMSRVRAAQSPLRLTAEAEASAAVLTGTTGPKALPQTIEKPRSRTPGGTTAPASNSSEHTGDAEAKPAKGAAQVLSPAIRQLRRQVNDALQAMGIDAQRFAARATQKWGEGWSKDQPNLKAALEVLNTLEPSLSAVKTSLAGLGLEEKDFDPYASSQYSQDWRFDRQALVAIEQELMHAFKDRDNYVAAVRNLVAEEG